MKKKSLLFISILSLFVLSGLASLIYQVVWFKQLSYFLGNTTYSQAVVLATFMGGLALGAWYWGKKADSIKNNLRLFAYLEIVLALYCYFYSPIFDLFAGLFTDFVIYFELPVDSFAVLSSKLAVSGATILFPTFLMGGTLPVLVRFLTTKSNEVGKNVAVLYFVNSLGAVLGTVLAGFFLLQMFGLKMTTFIGASFEMAVGITCLVLSYRVKEEVLPETNSNQPITKPLYTVSKRQYHLVLWIAALTGFCAMVYEVGWFRLLIPILSSSTYSFTLILTVFITGITLGSFLVYKFHSKIKNPLSFVGLCQFGIVISILFTLPFYEKIPFSIWQAMDSPEELSYNYYLFIQLSYVFALMIVPTVFMGMTLPVLSKMAVSDINKSGEAVGSVFAVNTLGTVIGSILAGLVLIPFMGIRHTIEFAVIINLALFLLTYLSNKNKTRLKIISFSLVFLITGIFYLSSVNSNRWAHAIMLSEIPRQINRTKPPATYTDFITQATLTDSVLYYKEGIGGTIVVATNQKEIFLTTNGKGDANTVSDLRTQISLGLTPVTLHPSPDSIFVIGFGAGTTIGHAASHPSVKYAEVAEISPEVIDASIYFNHVNENPLSNKKVRVVKDDGVSALRLSNRKYDVIISQPSNPWSAGVGNLFTSEFFRDCKTKLRSGGFVAQWFNLYEMDDRSLKLIMRTALDQFKYISLWHIGKSDILLLCSDTPLPSDLGLMKTSYDLIAKNLQSANIYSFAAFLSQQITSDMVELKAYAGKGELNTEDHPLLELWAPRAYFHNSSPTDFVKLDERNNFERSNLLLNVHLLKSKTVSMDDILQAGLFQSTGGSKKLAYYLADMNPEIYLMWSRKAVEVGDEVSAKEYLDLATKKGVSKEYIASVPQKTINPHHQRALLLGEQGKLQEAVNAIQKAIEEEPLNAELYYQKGTFLLSLNKLDEAKVALEKCISLDPNNVNAYNNLANVIGKQGDFGGAIKVLDKVEKLSKDNPKIYFNRGYAKGFLNDFSGAYKDFTKSIELAPDNGQAYLFRGHALRSMGRIEEACADFRKALSMNVQGAMESIRQTCPQ